MRLFKKGLTQGFGPKMAIFQTLFLGNICQENVFYDILERNNALLGYKNKKFKKSKNWHFSKGFNPWFWSKNGYFYIFLGGQYRAGKCVIRYCRTKKTGIFETFLFWGNIGQENVFYDIIEGKNPLLGYKNKEMKNSKN